MLAASASEESPAEPLPSAEMLMYLSEFEDAGGEFVDPLALEQVQVPAGTDAGERTGRASEEKDDDAAARDD